MSRTARMWKGVGSLTLGGTLLTAGIAARADDSPSLAQQLINLGRQAASQGRAEDARTFYANALKLDPSNTEAREAVGVRRVSFQDPAAPAEPVPSEPVPATPAIPSPGPDEGSTVKAHEDYREAERQRIVAEIRQQLQKARDLVHTRQPEAALGELRNALDSVLADVSLTEDTKRRLANEVRNAIGATEKAEERIRLETAEAVRRNASQELRKEALDRLVSDQYRTKTLMDEYDSLMTEGIRRVLKSGGLADIDVTRQPFYDARLNAQYARAIIPDNPTPWAGMFVSDSIGFYSQTIQYDRLKEYRYMLSLADVDRSGVPFPDTRVIEYPEKAAWQELSERRIARYGDADYLFDRDEKTKAILNKLNERITMNFPNDTPLEDVKKYIEQSTQDEAAGLPTGIPIYVDPQGLNDADKTMASTVSINLEGIPLKTTLRLILKQLGMTYTVKDGLLTITSTSSEDQPTEIRVYQVADLALIPLSLMGGGAGGGMGGGMGGMGGGGMGGMGGGGMGGMGGGMGGMGGMMSVPPQDPSQVPAGSSVFEEKKSN